MGAAITKGFGEANVPFWKERVLATRLEVVREDVMMDPWELSMVAFVNWMVLTVGDTIMFCMTISVLV